MWREWVKENDAKLADAVERGENDPFLTPIVLAKMFDFRKMGVACSKSLQERGFLIPDKYRLLKNGYLCQRKMRWIEKAVVDEWDNYYRNGRRKIKGSYPNQRNLTQVERDTVCEIIKEHYDGPHKESLLQKLSVKPFKGGKSNINYMGKMNKDDFFA